MRVQRPTRTNTEREIYGDYGMQLFHVFIEFCDNREPEARRDAVRQNLDGLRSARLDTWTDNRLVLCKNP